MRMPIRRPTATHLIIGASLIAAVTLLRARVGRTEAARTALLGEIATSTELDTSFAFAPAEGLIAVGTDSGDPGLVLVLKSGGTRRLPLASAWVRQPTLSADGRWLAYHELDVMRRSAEHRLDVMELASERPRLVRETGDDDFVARASFSPNGALLVYELVHRLGDEKWQDELRLYELGTGADRSLYRKPDIPARAPAWRPDGRSVIFLSGNCLREIDIATARERALPCVPGMTPPATPPDPPSISSDGKVAAYALERGGCPHVVVSDLEPNGTARPIAPNECANHPVWVAGTRRIAFVLQQPDGSRSPKVRTLGFKRAESLGFDDSITYGLAAAADGTIIALLGSPNMPRALWRLHAGDHRKDLVYTPFDLRLVPSIALPPSQVWRRSSDGLMVPIRVFKPAGSRPARHAAVVFLHPGKNGSDDVAPRIYPEIAYLNAMGLSVYAVNYRGSTAYGADYKQRGNDIEGKIADAVLAVDFAREQSDVDPDQLFVFGSCYGNALIGPLVQRRPHAIRGVIDWMGEPMPWLLALPQGNELPPVLWLSGLRAPGAENHASVASAARALGHALELVELDQAHWLLDARERARAFERISAFLTAHIQERSLSAHEDRRR